MKNLITMLTFCWIGVSCSVGEQRHVELLQSPYEDVQEHEVREVSNAELTFLNRWADFGSVPRDTILVARYDFVNSGRDTLSIRSVQPDCVFRGFYLSDEMIAPGDSAYVLLELGTGNMGGYLKNYATIETNTNRRFHNLILEAFINP